MIGNDEFYTQKKHVEVLLEILKGKNIKRIWCPADELKSQYVKVLSQAGYEVISSHINQGQDFLTIGPPDDFDIIITNPPFSIKKEWFEKCLEYKKPFILLVPNTMMMYKVVKQNADKISYLFFEKRINFLDPDGKKVSPSDTIYLTYDVMKGNRLLNEKK